MKKLYFLLQLYVIILAPILVISLGGGGAISWVLIFFQLGGLLLLQLGFKETKKELFDFRVSTYSYSEGFKMFIFNVFASDKEKDVKEDTRWVDEFDENLKHINEVVDTK